MIKSLVEIIKQLLGLAKDTQDNKDVIKVMQARLEAMTESLRMIIFELQRLKENEAHEREKMGLRLENALLRSERSLPMGHTEERPSLAGLQEQIDVLQKEIESLKKRIEPLENA